MNAVVIEHVALDALPDAWRAQLHTAGNSRVTVRSRIADSVSAGAYGEKDFGAGPLIGWGSGGFKIWSAVPVADRPKDGARLAVGMQVEF